MPQLLSKSDFKLASTCPKKLVYKKANYPTMNDASEYMEMLAQGGHIVGKYAQLIYSDGIEVKGHSMVEAAVLTDQLLAENEQITLFEATFVSNGKIVRTDILQKEGNRLRLIEVKSKSYDNEDDPALAKNKHTEYIEDVAFQALVLREKYPDHVVDAYMLLPDKSKRTAIEGLAGWFTVEAFVEEKFESETLPAQNRPAFKKPLVTFRYDHHPDREKYIAQLKSDNLLTLVPVNGEVNKMMDIIRNRANLFVDILADGIQPAHYALKKKCKACEFNLQESSERNGYRECWGALTDVKPHIFDLYFGGAIGHHTWGWYLDEMIAQGKVSFWDLDTERFRDAQGEFGSRGTRQLIQFEHTRSGTEWISHELAPVLNCLKYPLHFIDFETYQGAIPHHKGMRPYELVAFQWSCHTIPAPGAEPIHTEFLNCDYDLPNFRFAESLMQQIGETGTPLMWSSFENTILRNILDQMDIFEFHDPELRDWLTNITKDKDQGRTGRFLDMNEWTLLYYFHPDMKGRTSIKKVLPAIWNNHPYLHEIPWFSKYASAPGGSLDPYDNLAPVIADLENEEVVKDGTGAMKAYHELMFGAAAGNAERRAQLMQLLLQYCELDTMAMVIIWRYWMDRCGK